MFLIVNFGGPRNLDEVEPFLTELLTDRDVIQTSLPLFLHNWIFTRAARKRAIKIREDYALIGGKSPIYFDTENIAQALNQKLCAPVLTFHRYLPETHKQSLEQIIACTSETIRVIPLFPQFSYATTGSIARFFTKNLPASTLKKLHWVSAYPTHPAFVEAHQKKIQEFLSEKNIQEKNLAILFSAHGLPQKYVDRGDPYQQHCLGSYNAIRAAFPNAISHLSYQSKFGRGQWLLPYTEEVCKEALLWTQNRKEVIIVPLSFTTDHIETLFEIEQLYIPILKNLNIAATRCPALNLEPYWIDALATIAQGHAYQTTQSLVR